MKTKDIQELYKIKLHSMDTILHQISLMDQVENEQELSEIIHSLLQAIGNYTGADRVYVFDWETDQKDSLSNTFEWCADGVIPEIDNLQAIPVSLMPSWMKRFENKETIVIHDLESTKCSEPEEYELLKTQEICSLIAVPIYANHQMNGFIGVDNPDLSQNEISITLLSDVGGHLGCVRENLKSTVQLKKAFDEATKRTEIISAIATLYVTIIYANVKERTYELLKGHDLVQKILGQKGKIDDVMEQLPTAFAGLEERERYRKFLEFDTLTERLRNTNSVSIEFMGANGKWRQSRFIVKSRDAHGNAVDVLYVARDITEEKSRELMYQKRLKASMEDAHRANLSKTAFLQRMSHDIRTPMNAIMGMATIAKAHVDERERILDCMEKINGASKLLLSLINEVLDMSKIESGRLILSEDEFNVGELLQDLVVMMQPEIKNKQQTLNIHVKNLRHENVKGDTQRIKQVLMNILSNAIKYTPENGRITIEIYEKDPHNGIGNYQFVFEDNGRGMKPEFLDKIFEPFERASDDEIKRIQGTGLGMSISHKIIQMMGGDIKVESEYGKGSRFTIDMPLVCRDQKPDDKIEVEGLEVLVVDDDKIACLNMSSCLREIGINSECVYSGSEAIEKVRQHHLAEKEYFAVIIDLKMPQMNGIETTRQIRRFVGADVPIIILSAYDLEEYEAEAKEVKANGFITKPLYKSKLLQVLRSFLDEGDQPEPIRPFKLSNVDYSGKRILLVEDNELNREIAVEIIGSTGITIDTAINGLDAVHKVAQSEEGFYQIILMDIQMPIMDGYEATRQIRSLQRRDIAHMPIIAMTANAFSEDVTNAIKAGMNYHLAKPIDIGALMGILSKYLQAPA